MDLYSLPSSSLVYNSNWMRFFEDIINTEIQSLNALNLNINRDDIDSNEINIRFQLESERFQPLNFNTSSNWIQFLPLQYEGTNLNEINFSFSNWSTKRIGSHERANRTKLYKSTYLNNNRMSYMLRLFISKFMHETVKSM